MSWIISIYSFRWWWTGGGPAISILMKIKWRKKDLRETDYSCGKGCDLNCIWLHPGVLRALVCYRADFPWRQRINFFLPLYWTFGGSEIVIFPPCSLMHCLETRGLWTVSNLDLWYLEYVCASPVEQILRWINRIHHTLYLHSIYT